MVWSRMVRLLVALLAGSAHCNEPIQLFPADKTPGQLPSMGPEICSQMKTGVSNTTTCTNVSVPSIVPFLVRHSDTAVVIAPGGGFHGLAYSTEGTDIAKWLNKNGISAFVLKYRVPAAFGYNEVPMMDAQRAIRLVRSSASELGLNTSRVGIMGFSAGGDLAAGLSANFAERAYARIDDIDDESCRPDFALGVYPAVHTWAANITSEHPPTFFAQAENDPVSSELTVQYYLRLRNLSSAPSDLHIFPGAIHGYGLCNVRDAEGRIAVLIAPPEGPGLMPAFVPWSSVCLWPTMAKAFLNNLGLLKELPSSVIV